MRSPHERSMTLNKSARQLARILCVAASLGLVCTAALRAAHSPPEMTADGLRLQKNTGTRLIYVRPGATFGKYDKVAILDCLVEFDKNWQNTYNSQRVDPSNYVSTDDMNRIKKELATEFKKIFTRELQANGGYPVVDIAAPDVLVLRPAIINLRVTQPDLMTPGVDMTVIRSAGSMTLYLELWDSMTNKLLARVMDAQTDQGLGGPQVANSVTNTTAADFILRQWATALRKALEAARASSTG
jgi:hypothetical protein